MSVEGMLAAVVCAALVAVPLFAVALPTERALPLGAMVRAVPPDGTRIRTRCVAT